MKVCKNILFGGILLGLLLLGSLSVKAAAYPTRYRVPTKTKQLIVVNYEGNSKARLTYYSRDSKGKFVKRFSTAAWIGKNGINKKKEGDGKSPKGLYSLDQAFGICKNPGSKMKYTKVTAKHYWCDDSSSPYYNRMIVASTVKHKCGGEQLISCKGSYDYALAVGYNKKGVPGKGSAIFLHCSKNHATAGCIAVSKDMMKKILLRLNPTKRPMILIDRW